ncbi:M1 family aminopeptidase [Rheinheimera sp.]|uniref:M1 family aminopeptidase n=1 Tax=Rheinheimera sp. TaxID=1869214 RepID=UPI0027328AF8|nr:M1 family aminopeptidase [Rheinheimera sp.]MDP2714350.1 M1 family aminopeptidase [Rheinheimera sp.]
MLLLKLLHNEWRYLIRQPLLWLALILLPLAAYIFATGITGIDTIADKRLQALHMTLLMFYLPLLCGALAPLMLLRDQNHDMTELIHSTPVPLAQRLLARAAVLTLLFAGLMLIGFSIIYYLLCQHFGFQASLLRLNLWDFAFMALPACAFYAMLAGCLTQRFSSNVVLYAVFAGLWLVYLVLASMTGAPMLAGSTINSDALFNVMRLLDPFGNTALIALYQHNPPQLYGDSIFYLSRLLYCLLTAGLFYLSLRLKPYQDRVKPLPDGSSHQLVQQQPYRAVTAKPVGALQLWQLTRTALTTLLKQRLNQFILLGWTLLLGNEVLSGINYAEPLAVLHPTSLDALNRIADDVLPFLGSLLTLLWSYQLNWRNRHSAMAELIAAAPVRSGILLAGNMLALTALILLMMLLSALACLAAEWLANSEINLRLYPEVLGKVALPLTLLGALFSVFHTICRSPLTAAACCVVTLLLKYTPLSGKLGLTHTMWNIAGSPLQPADAYWRFEQSQSVFWPFMTFWLLLSIGLLWLAARWSHRSGSFTNAKRWTLNLSSSLLLILAVMSGVHLHLNIIAERPLMSSDLREQWRANYEQRYASWAAVAQPGISHIDAQVDIYPQQGEAVFTLNYTLQNRTAEPVSKLLVGNYSASTIAGLRLSVPHSIEADQQLGQYVLTLTQPLAPGDTVQMHSKLNFRQPSYWPAVLPQLVKPSFSYLRGIPLLPTLGFQTEYQLRNPELRQQYGLAPLELTKPSRLFAVAQGIAPVHPAATAQYDWVNLHSVVSTDIGQTPLAQGELVRQWQQHGRQYAEFQTRGPIRNALAWYSISGQTLSRQHGATRLTLYSPLINAAAELNMQAMQDTLDWMTQHIAPYRGTALSLLAMPDMGATGYALPQLIMINHRVGFRAEPSADAGFDQRYRRAVHETAHQWFGHDIGNGVLADSAFLVESLAKYVELVLIEQRYGSAAMQALVEYERERFALAVRRSTQQRSALVDATASHDLYSRATLVFAILRQQLGDAVISQALRQLWQQHAYPKTPATSMDFVRALQAQVKPQQQQLVQELLLGTSNTLLIP